MVTSRCVSYFLCYGPRVVIVIVPRGIVLVVYVDGLYSTVVKAYGSYPNGRGFDTSPPIEVSTLRQGAYTNCASLHPGV